MRIQNKIKSTYVDITINILVYSFLGFSTCMYVLHMQTHTHTHTRNGSKLHKSTENPQSDFFF